MAPTTDSSTFWKNRGSDFAERYGKRDGPAAMVPGLPALELIKHSGVVNAAGPLVILDNAAGPALIAGYIYDQLSEQHPDKLADLEIICGDTSAPMIQAAQAKIDAENWKGIEARILDQNDLSSFKDESFTHVLTGLGIGYAVQPDKTLQEMARILKPGGVCAFSTWDKVDYFAIAKEAFERIPGAPAFPDQATAFMMMQHDNPWHDTEWVKSTTSKHFAKVEQFRNAAKHSFTLDEYIELFAGPTIVGMLGVFWDKEDVAKYGEKLAPTVRAMFEERKMEHVEIEMVAIITVGVKE